MSNIPAQYLQILHGAVTPAVRTPNTLAAIQALHDAAYLSRQEYQQLSEAYVFLRHLIDALRIVRGHARDLLLPPTSSEEFIFLARRLGDRGDQRPPSRLATDIAHHMTGGSPISTTHASSPPPRPLPAASDAIPLHIPHAECGMRSASSDSDKECADPIGPWSMRSFDLDIFRLHIGASWPLCVLSMAISWLS